MKPKNQFLQGNNGALQENRRQYRELFITAEGIGSSLSGCILHPETLFQKASDGRSFCEILKQENIAAGVKVDKVSFAFIGNNASRVSSKTQNYSEIWCAQGLEALEGCEGESHTKGLDSLAENCKAYVR